MPIYELDGQAPEFPDDGRYWVCFNMSYMDRECDEWAVAFLCPRAKS